MVAGPLDPGRARRRAARVRTGREPPSGAQPVAPPAPSGPAAGAASEPGWHDAFGDGAPARAAAGSPATEPLAPYLKFFEYCKRKLREASPGRSGKVLLRLCAASGKNRVQDEDRVATKAPIAHPAPQ